MSELEKLNATVADWERQRPEKLAALAVLERDAPGRILRNEMTTQDYAQQREQLRTEVDALAGVLSALEQQRPDAERQAHVARIAAMRQRADELEAEAAPILEKRADLLRQLEALEGKQYMAEPRSQLLMVQAQRLRDGAIDAEAKLAMPRRETDEQGNEVRRRRVG